MATILRIDDDLRAREPQRVLPWNEDYNVLDSARCGKTGIETTPEVFYGYHHARFRLSGISVVQVAAVLINGQSNVPVAVIVGHPDDTRTIEGQADTLLQESDGLEVLLSK